MDTLKSTKQDLVQVIMNDAQLKETILSNIIKMFTNRGVIKHEHQSAYLANAIVNINQNDESVISLDSDESNVLGTDKINVKFISRKITTIRRVVDIEEFMNKREYKIVVVENVAPKAVKQFLEYNNTEMFYDYELHINLVDHQLVPTHIKLNDVEKDEFIETYNYNANIGKRMFQNDPVARYYNYKVGDIIRIERASINSGWSIDYRVVVAGSMN